MDQELPATQFVAALEPLPIRLASTGYWRHPSSLTSSRTGVSGRPARGGQTYDSCSPSRYAFLDSYVAL